MPPPPRGPRQAPSATTTELPARSLPPRHDAHVRYLGPLLAVLLAAAHFYFIPETPDAAETNATSRIYLTLAIVQDGSLAIDNCLARYGDTPDKAFQAVATPLPSTTPSVGATSNQPSAAPPAAARGHYFTDKAPGPSLLLVPLAWLLDRTMLHGAPLDTWNFWLRLLGLTLPSVVCWWLWLGSLSQAAGMTRRGAATAIVCGALGTNFLIYATQLFAHAYAAWFLLAGWLLAERAVRHAPGPAAIPAFAAGFCWALAFTSDYVVALALPALWAVEIVAVGSIKRKPRVVAAWVVPATLGMAGPLVAWMAYNYACFGHPLRVGFLAHATPAYQAAYSAGWFGIHAPSVSALVGLLFSPARGLLFLSPVLVLAPYGWWLSWRQGERRAAVSCLAAFLGIWLFAATTVDWRGGWACGPRYLVPAIPFLVYGLARVFSAIERPHQLDGPPHFPWLAVCCLGLAAVSFGNVFWAQSTSPLATQEFRNPMASLWLPLAVEGHFTRSLLAVVLGDAAAWLAILVPISAIMWTTKTLVGRARGPRLAAVALAVSFLVLQVALPERPSEHAVLIAARAGALIRLGELTAADNLLDALTPPTSAAGGVP